MIKRSLATIENRYQTSLFSRKKSGS